ncbi:MAG: HD-GYP domain-containing protein [Syntrophorhabdaceae bacterium]|nr:HD-GYP domain-containing protein [Syntrophorhabdaceae bacterium]
MSEDNLHQLLEYLARAAKEVSRGDYRSAGEIFELTKSGKYPPGITELAEAFGMMMVMVEAREENLERLIENLREQKGVLENTSKALHQANIGVLEVLGSAIAKRDHGTSAHNYRVTLYAFHVAAALGHDEKHTRSLIKGSFLHDVGKIGISDAILLKEGHLTGREFEIMKGHVQHGSDIVNSYSWLNDCLDVVLYHHEKFNGTGYMAGLKGDDIPINARIFAVADVFDALTSARPYKGAMSYDEAMDMMRKGRGSHFDPEIVDSLCGLGDALYREIYFGDEDHLRNTLKGRVQDLFREENNH